MKIKYEYECEYCGKRYDKADDCAKCEKEHLTYTDQIIYDILRKEKNPCDFCKNQYLVYGCEPECSEKCVKYKKFVPTKPLHDKRHNGGV